MMRVFVVVPPACEPISLAEAKEHLRISHDYEDAQITRMIRSARDYCEQYTRRVLITQTLTAVFAGGRNSSDVWLPREPIQSVTAVEMDGVPVNSGAVSLRTATVCVPANMAERANEIVITYVAGYGDKPEDVPSQLRDGMLRHVASLFNNRGDLEGDAGAVMLQNVRELYTPYRSMTVDGRW